tara:strand:+ start:108296 stop:108718 length:423 start_codon:yes stop_codon:yes gene_type:complete
MKKKILIILMVMGALTTACKSMVDTNDNDRLAGTWTLTYITGPRIAFDGLYPKERPTMEFDLAANTVSGSTSCNRFNTSFTLDGSAISLGNIATTKMFCEGQGEATFINMLPKVNNFQVKEDVLSFYMDEVEMMRFTKTP